MSDHPVSASSSRVNRWLALALILSTLTLLAWLGLRAVRTGLYARAALDDLDRLQGVLAQPSPSALPQAQADLASLQTHLAEAQAAGRPFLRIAPALGWVPRYGTDLVAAPQLVDMAVEVATAGRTVSDALGPIASQVAGEGGGLDALPKALDALVSAQGDLEEADARLARAADFRAAMPPLTEPRLVRQLEKVDKLLPLARDGVALAKAAPGLLGADGPRTYLLLAQNSDELRATGGFISGAGHVTIDHGRLTDLVLKDSYAVDNWEQPHPHPPAAISKYMAADLWVLRDTNWAPDFPTSADVARALYAQDQGVETDGAVALDLEAVRRLVGAVGPLQVPGVAEPVTGANALQWMKSAWETPAGTSEAENAGQGGRSAWWLRRKDFMGELVKAALAKVQAGGDFDAVALARALYTSLDERHLQAAVDDPTLAALLAQRGWDGGVRPPEGSDFLSVIDSNVGFNKANALVGETLDYQVREGEQGLEGTLTISYTHNGPAGAEPVCDRNAGYGPDYNALAARCYWDYLRVYAPPGAELIEAQGLNSVATEPGERDAVTFTGDFVLKPGESHSVTLRYRLPSPGSRDGSPGASAGVSSKHYQLYVRKQAGTAAWPLVVTYGDCRAQTKLETDFRFTCPPVAPPPAVEQQ